MKTIRGLVLAVDGRTTTILTPDGEFLTVRTPSPIPAIGEEITVAQGADVRQLLHNYWQVWAGTAAAACLLLIFTLSGQHAERLAVDDGVNQPGGDMMADAALEASPVLDSAPQTVQPETPSDAEKTPEPIIIATATPLMDDDSGQQSDSEVEVQIAEAPTTTVQCVPDNLSNCEADQNRPIMLMAVPTGKFGDTPVCTDPEPVEGEAVPPFDCQTDGETADESCACQVRPEDTGDRDVEADENSCERAENSSSGDGREDPDQTEHSCRPSADSGDGGGMSSSGSSAEVNEARSEGDQ